MYLSTFYRLNNFSDVVFVAIPPILAVVNV